MGTGVVNEVTQTIQLIASTTGPSVVGIGQGWGVGCGVVLGKDLVLTNAHNALSDRLDVTFIDGRTVNARLAGTDVDGDVAVLAVETGDAVPIEWAANVEVGVGSPVFALANPGGRGLRITFGLVSSVGRSFRGPRGRRVTGSVEHTAPMGRGSSGGPIVDPAGRLVGLNTNRLGQGFYLAIPADADLRRRVDALGRGQSPSRRRLGVGIVPGRAARHLRRAVGLPERDGVLIRVVEEDGPAAEAGLRQGDLIVAAAGRPLATGDDLYSALDRLDEHSALDLTVLRGADELTVTVAFGGAGTEGDS